MSAEIRSKKLSYRDYLALPDDSPRYELIEGELIMVAAPNPRHQCALTALLHDFVTYFEAGAQGIALPAPLDVILADDTVVQPDLVVIRDRKRLVHDAVFRGPPDLSVEILSPSNRRHDVEVKHRLYARYGVPEYWIVDPDARRVEIFVLRGAAFVKAADIREGVVASHEAFPGFSTTIARIFRLLD